MTEREAQSEDLIAEIEGLGARLAAQAPAGGEWSLRLLDRRREWLGVRQGVVQPPALGSDRGVMVTFALDGGHGYAATSDLSPKGARRAFAAAAEWARASRALGLVDDWREVPAVARSRSRSLLGQPWGDSPPEAKLALLGEACAAMAIDAAIVDSQAWLGYRRDCSLLLSGAGASLLQWREYLHPGLSATAHRKGQTQRRSGAGAGGGRQGGLEQLAELGFPAQGPELAEQALALTGAPECPSGRRDLLLMPAQMVLQIHESIGHPLELDRILGDERNYAGTSFVRPEMFGSYRYGSALLNVTFDPSHPQQLASYDHDDEGTPARREYLIRDGVLLRPLGGALSQRRAGLEGVACARASGWNRPPIDRMANLNLEPGGDALAALIARVERGVLMETNRSWSIDDSRNKFQFGCEYGRLIEDGELRGLVRNPGYRGVSAHFWQGLAGVADASEWRVAGTGNCGKGEPNQQIAVGHAAPPCLFRDVEVFGGG